MAEAELVPTTNINKAFTISNLKLYTQMINPKKAAIGGN